MDYNGFSNFVALNIHAVTIFFSRPSPKARRELQTVLNTRDEGGGPLAKNQPEPVTGP